MESILKFSSGDASLEPAPINSAWILEGNPVARNRILSTSKDGSASALIWECTAGKFNWFYDVDETVYIIEGSVLLKDANGAERRVSVGETVHFPVGCKAEWTIDKYVRKVAFCAAPMPLTLRVIRKAIRVLKRLTGGSPPASATAMFGTTK